jgi:UDP-N-acetylglucosamine 2-epimerase
MLQIGPRALQAKQRTVSEVMSAVERARTASQGRVIVGTMEYGIYKYFDDSDVAPTFLPLALSYETDAQLYGEALAIAQDLVQKVGGERDLLFRGINLLDILLFDLTAEFRTIVGMKQFAQSIASGPGVAIILTGLGLFAKGKPICDLPVQQLIQVGEEGARGKSGITVLRRVLGSLLPSLPRKRVAAVIPIIRDGKKRVLFVTTDTPNRPENSEPLVFVLRELEKHADLAPLVAADALPNERYFREKNIENVVKYSRFESSEAENHWRKSEPVLRRKAEKLLQQYGARTTKGLMVSTFLQQFLNKGRFLEVYSRILWLENIFERFQPDIAVIFSTYSYIGMAASKIARNRRIPTIGSSFRLAYAVEPHPQFWHCGATDFVAGYGEHFGHTLAAIGIDPRRYIPIGNPKFDQIPSSKYAEDRRYVCNKFRVSPESHIFLVATYLVSPGSREWIPALVRQLKRLHPGTFKLIIKPHPDEDSVGYERILQKEKFEGADISRDVPIYALVDASDIVFTSTSVVGSEAVLFNKPVICINLSDVEYPYRYDEHGVALLVRRESDIIPAIEAVLFDEKVKHELEVARKRVQRLYAVELDGRSSERFADAIRQVISTSAVTE